MFSHHDSRDSEAGVIVTDNKLKLVEFKLW